ncbi:S-adenosylmethionine decarboxylase proenzyme [Leptospira kirschneri str. 200803703]|uniref:S-adenosylmethionine decarboxylase proenzyme n=1 Tax=Leptospira kirschneri str. 200802841 TaxID=1193047 RepID=A0A828YB28_9LEPT|nr:S-adenosylmethionine decarboxylase proenzyme [Leptospira kirschneri serovar Grippotyphosa str. RM52]EKO53807.1 S-adenosylmethionine decarboxylase proenzyme [Leptospira kirschneri str. 200802841]EKP06898.1 S-adenosylmethionine decarboxylase proenzyme [Leptospira kirschneri str. 2008720114]EKQ85472.1 S-adenosylmethionine decarboxylase proenzyme [Leptospira kirschneri serovar Grippotyphosa str. Moskva]EKR09437.1 S-adenosylmethionine decarboxylase proenzyme [Leptospira kirschneri serovar Valbuzz
MGKHVIAEFYECDYETINNHELVEDIMLKSVDLSGATTIKSVFHRFSPYGVSGVVVVSESHFAIHTWPEYGYCAVDVFTCGDLIDNQAALDYLKEKFGSRNVSVVEMKRGVLNLGVDLHHKPVGN